jgi:hypothetical protein
MPNVPVERPKMRKPTKAEIDKHQKEKYEELVREEDKRHAQQNQNPQPAPTPPEAYVLVEYVDMNRDKHEPMVWTYMDTYINKWVRVTIGPKPPANHPVALAPWQAVVQKRFIEGRVAGQPFAWRIVRDVLHDEFSQPRLVPMQAIGVTPEPPKAPAQNIYVDAPPDLLDDFGDIEVPPADAVPGATIMPDDDTLTDETEQVP